MRKLISLCAVIALFVISCDSPITNIGDQQQSPDISSVIPPGASRAEVDSIRSQLWRRFQSVNGSSWQIRKSKRTGLPVSIFAGLTKKTYNGPPREAARAFLADHIALFGFENLKQLHYTDIQRHRGVSSVSFRQYYQGIPVAGAEFKVHIRNTGKIGFANGYYYPNITISPSPSLSANAAISAAKQDLGLTSQKGENNNAELFVLPI